MKYRSYRGILKKSEYKVLDFGFVPYASNKFLKWVTNIKKYKDSFYETKHIFPSYDILISNIGDKVLIEFVNPELVKEFYAHEGTTVYEKYKEFLKNAKRSIGSSIVFDEGEIWKRKRKLMTTLLNYNYLISKQ